MSRVLDEIKAKFGTVKKAGADGEKLASVLQRMLDDQDWIIAEFEAGMQSEEWSNNFAAFGGEEAMIFAQNAYSKIKASREDLKSIGL